MLVDLIGKRFGKLTVTGFIPGTHTKPKKWICKCDCGNITNVVANSLNRENGTKSCGCLSSRHSVGERRTTHGDAKRGKISKEFRTWCHMRERCYVITCKEYPRWGGRGIKVCDRWLESFENFLSDVGRAPSPKHSLDRFPNNDGNYEPTNFRWATPSQQRRNQRGTVIVEFNGIKKPLADWCDELNLSYRMMWTRIIKRGYSVKKAFEKPTGRYSNYIDNNFISHSFGYINA